MNKNLISTYLVAILLFVLAGCNDEADVTPAPQISSADVNSEKDDAAGRKATGKYIAEQITGTINGIAFTADYRITRFVSENNALYAIGTLNNIMGEGLPAAIADLSGQTVKMPVERAPAPDAAAAAAVGACDILFLQLGPLDLDLLGLVVHLDQVLLDIDAQTGAGNLLGNLLCAITGLFDGAGALTAIANLLNRVIEIIGTLP